MVSIDVRLDIKDVTRMLTRVQRKQVPFAAAVALTNTVKDIKRAEDVQIPKKLKAPTRFTLNAIGIKTANKRKLTASVYVKDIQGRYLLRQIEGGTRRTKLISVPINVKLNKFGNIPGLRAKKKKWLRGETTSKNQFVGTVKGIHGLWQRIGKRNLKLIVAFESEAKYKKRFPFYKIAEGVGRSRFPRNFNTALQRAIDTAR